MGIRFIHTADWQIGREFRRFDDGTASALFDARLDAIDAIAGLAATGRAPHVLVAGDVFDGPNLASKTLRQTLERLRRHAGVHWWLLPGNHDPARPGGVWTRLLEFGLPGNVTVFTEPGVRELAPGVCLLASPLTSKQVSRDPTDWMDGASTAPGSLRIGLAHGSMKDFGSTGADAMINPNRAKLAGLDYLALGDWHGATEVDARTWYSGTPEPDRFRANEPGYALLVTVDGQGSIPRVERHRTSRYTWLAHTAELAGVDRLPQIEQTLLQTAPEPRDLLVQLTLTGRLSASGHAQLVDWRDALEAKVRHLIMDTSGLAISVGNDDFALFGDDALLRDIAVRLGSLAETESDGPTAKAALTKLFDVARRARGALK